jgi:hypothetical protein
VLDATTSSIAPLFNRAAKAHKVPRTLNDPVGSSASNFNPTRRPASPLKNGTATNRVTPKYPTKNSRASRIVSSSGRIIACASLTNVPNFSRLDFLQRRQTLRHVRKNINDLIRLGQDDEHRNLQVGKILLEGYAFI